MVVKLSEPANMKNEIYSRRRSRQFTVDALRRYVGYNKRKDTKIKLGYDFKKNTFSILCPFLMVVSGVAPSTSAKEVPHQPEWQLSDTLVCVIDNGPWLFIIYLVWNLGY